MAALICDLCGGKLVMGAGGIATCDSCGMEHSADRMKEKVQEIKGTVRVDSTHMIENYLEMANAAFDAGNNAEAESYCNKIIEIDPTNHKAWFLKGKAAGWQSSLQNSRLPESIIAFTKAVTNAPEQDREDLAKQTKEEIIRLFRAMISLRGNRFIKWPGKEEANGVVSDLSSFLDLLTQFVSRTGVAISISEFMAPILGKINEFVVKAGDIIVSAFNSNYANKDAWVKCIEEMSCCIDLLENTMFLCEEDDENDYSRVHRYKNLIDYQKNMIELRSLEYTYKNGMWIRSLSKDEAPKNICRGKIREYEAKIAAIQDAKEKKEKAAAQKRMDDYWAEHSDEKNALEAERESLESQISTLRTEISSIPGNAEKESIQERINALTAEMNSLRIFKGKEKKAIQEKIDAATLELKKVVDRMDAATQEIEEQIHPLQERLDEINAELTKAR